jgi:hypothetical protein
MKTSVVITLTPDNRLSASAEYEISGTAPTAKGTTNGK